MWKQANPVTFLKKTYTEKTPSISRFQKLHPITGFFFQIIGRHIFGKTPQFMTINLQSKKQIRRLQKRGLQRGSTVAESARDQNAAEMKCEMKNDSREDENERNVSSGVVSEDIESTCKD